MILQSTFIYFLFLYPIVRDSNCQSVPEASFGKLVDAAKNVYSDGETTTEIHYATCKITTEKLSADAQAKFTRVLTGVCNAKAMEERFERLERTLNERLNEIHDLIVASMTRQKFNFSESRRNDASMLKAAFTRGKYFSGNWLDDIDENEYEEDERKETGSMRRDEIERYNNTVHDEDRRKIYTYYWRVSNLSEKLLEWETGRSERSSSFYVGDSGYAMYLRFTPKYFPDGTIFISAGLTNGRNDSVLHWPFLLQIRIEILDLTSRGEEKPIDRSSRLWDPATVCSSYFWGRPRWRIIEGSWDNPECLGLSVPRHILIVTNADKRATSSPSSSTLLIGRYVSNNSLLVKLTVYLL